MLPPRHQRRHFGIGVDEIPAAASHEAVSIAARAELIVAGATIHHIVVALDDQLIAAPLPEQRVAVPDRLYAIVSWASLNML